MNEEVYKKIADELKKERGLEILIDSADEKEKTLFECYRGDIKKFTKQINKALDNWEKEKEGDIFKLKHIYRKNINLLIAPFVIKFN